MSITSEGTANIKYKLGKMTFASVKCGKYKKTTQNENYKFFFWAYRNDKQRKVILMYVCKLLPSKQSIIDSQFFETLWFQMKQHKF